MKFPLKNIEKLETQFIDNKHNNEVLRQSWMQIKILAPSIVNVASEE